ncbi:MAG TPA: maleylacetate reductase [Candidatus Saccharimonadales bacterium]|nr:maleylacetate reductase [Candidatus Saccharimonadales bacterium]
MTHAFTWSAFPSRVVFAAGALERIPDEVARLGRRRVLLIGSGASTDGALSRLRAALGTRCAAEVPKAAQHVPSDLADAAVRVGREAVADVVVTVGGGSATGLGKAVAQACDVPLVAVPTTYSGSEMTPIWGRTTGGRKQTWSDVRVLPRTVVYDPELCIGMPPRLAAATGMNALAHCLEALWSSGANPITGALAREGGQRLTDGLPRVVEDPSDVVAHADNLIGACLAGAALAQAGTGIHHRTCHVLGGGWNLPHAETHAVLLPHTTALVGERLPEAMDGPRRLLGSDDPPVALFTLLHRLRLPQSLAMLGMPEDALAEAARRVFEASRDDPLVHDEGAVRRMLDGAFAGREPQPLIGSGPARGPRRG